jgi:hypothetical protein
VKLIVVGAINPVFITPGFLAKIPFSAAKQLLAC